MNFLIIGIGGFLGAIARYSVSLLFSGGQLFPLSTLLVNVSGCAAIGFIYEYATKNNVANTVPYLLITTGFLGAFTTFSAFGLETVNLLKNGNYLFAGLNIFANVFLGMMAVYLPKLIL